MIVHSEATGIVKIQEGRFLHGEQYDFGRVMIIQPNAFEQMYIKQDMVYTGWWPTAQLRGVGIGVLDTSTIYQGEWQPVDGFPNHGRDIYAPVSLYMYNIADLTQREMWRGLIFSQNYQLVEMRDDTVTEGEEYGSWWTHPDRWWNREQIDEPDPEEVEETE